MDLMEKAMSVIRKNGYAVADVKGVLMVYVPEDERADINRFKRKIGAVMVSVGYESSWGVSVRRADFGISASPSDVVGLAAESSDMDESSDEPSEELSPVEAV